MQKHLERSCLSKKSNNLRLWWECFVLRRVFMKLRNLPKSTEIRNNHERKQNRETRPIIFVAYQFPHLVLGFHHFVSTCGFFMTSFFCELFKHLKLSAPSSGICVIQISPICLHQTVENTVALFYFSIYRKYSAYL